MVVVLVNCYLTVLCSGCRPQMLRLADLLMWLQQSILDMEVSDLLPDECAEQLFSERVVKVCNSLPPSTVNFSSLVTFRNSSEKISLRMNTRY